MLSKQLLVQMLSTLAVCSIQIDSRFLSEKKQDMSTAPYYPSFYDQLGHTAEGQCDISEFKKSIPDDGKYETTVFSVTTDDGYILQLFRVRLVESERNKLEDNQRKNINRPILINHGIGGDATYMIASSDNSIGFYLVNKGFDCWFSNNRGTKFSLGHTNANIPDSDYWNFSFQEMGLFDDLANYKTILSHYAIEKDKKIIYLAHSQGTVQMFAALSDNSTKDFMRKHTEHFMALSPIAYMNRISDTALTLVSIIASPIYNLAKLIGLYKVGGKNCGTPPSMYDKIIEFFGVNKSNGMAIKQYVHFSQLINGKCYICSDPETFRPYDYGESENKKRYGQHPPPEWKFSDWTTPTTLIIGTKDNFSSEQQRSYLINAFPKELGVEMNVFDGWNHDTDRHPPDTSREWKILDDRLGVN